MSADLKGGGDKKIGLRRGFGGLEVALSTTKFSTLW
jgi:hypothetical protein